MTDQPKAAHKRHVLVVDDNAELALTFQELLTTFGYRVTTADDGVQALKFLMDHEVDAILCDMSMPKLEGDMFYDAAVRVRPELAARFIFVTGNLDNPKYEPFLKKVAAEVLYKPVSVVNLLKVLAGMFAKTSGH